MTVLLLLSNGTEMYSKIENSFGNMFTGASYIFEQDTQHMLHYTLNLIGSGISYEGNWGGNTKKIIHCTANVLSSTN